MATTKEQMEAGSDLVTYLEFLQARDEEQHKKMMLAGHDEREIRQLARCLRDRASEIARLRDDRKREVRAPSLVIDKSLKKSSGARPPRRRRGRPPLSLR